MAAVEPAKMNILFAVILVHASHRFGPPSEAKQPVLYEKPRWMCTVRYS